MVASARRPVAARTSPTRAARCSWVEALGSAAGRSGVGELPARGRRAAVLAGQCGPGRLWSSALLAAFLLVGASWLLVPLKYALSGLSEVRARAPGSVEVQICLPSRATPPPPPAQSCKAYPLTASWHFPWGRGCRQPWPPVPCPWSVGLGNSNQKTLFLHSSVTVMGLVCAPRSRKWDTCEQANSVGGRGTYRHSCSRFGKTARSQVRFLCFH